MARRRMLDGETDANTGDTVFGMNGEFGESFGESFGGDADEVGDGFDPYAVMEKIASDNGPDNPDMGDMGDMEQGATRNANTERPRDVFPDNNPRTSFAPPPPMPTSIGTPYMESNNSIDLSLLPQGVEAGGPQPGPSGMEQATLGMGPEPSGMEQGRLDMGPGPSGMEPGPAPLDMDQGPPQSVEAAPQSTAMASFTPSPVSTRDLPPASPDAMAPSTPARQPFTSPSAIFGGQGSRRVGGRSSGLTGGGLSMPGGPSGRPKPTEEMLQLLRSFGVGR